MKLLRRETLLAKSPPGCKPTAWKTVTMQFERTFSIHCSPEVLWEFLEDPEKQLQWMHGVVENRATNDVQGRGATFAMRIKEGGKVVDYEGVVTEHNRPSLLTVEMRGGCMTPDSVMRATYELSRAPEGTQLVYRFVMVSVDLPFFWRLLMPLAKLMASWHVKRMFRSLKQVAEAAEGGASPAPSGA